MGVQVKCTSSILAKKVPKKQLVERALAQLESAYDDASDSAKPVVANAIIYWVMITNNFWNDTSISQAQKWLNQKRDASDAYFVAAMDVAIATRIQRSRMLRNVPPSDKEVADLEKKLLHYLSLKEMPDAMQLALLRQITEKGAGFVYSAALVQRYVDLVSSEEARGMPPLAAEIHLLVKAALDYQPGPEISKIIAPVLKESIDRSLVPSTLYDRVYCGPYAYRRFLQILADAGEQDLAQVAKKLDHSEVHIAYHTALPLIEIGEWDAAKAKLPKNTPGDNVTLGTKYFVPYRVSQRLFDQLDLFHQEINDPLQSLNIELGLYKAGRNTQGNFGIADAPLTKRVSQSFDRFANLKDISSEQKAKTLALLSARHLPTERQLDGWLSVENYTALASLEMSELDSAHAKAVFLMLGYHYQNRELWEAVLADLKGDYNENQFVSQMLVERFFVDVLSGATDNYQAKAEMWKEYLQAVLALEYYDRRTMQSVAHTAEVAHGLADIPFKRAEVFGTASESFKKQLNQSLNIRFSWVEFLICCRYRSLHFVDHSLREDLKVSMVNDFLANPKIVGDGYVSAMSQKYMAGLFMTEAEESALLRSNKISADARAAMELSIARRKIYHKKTADQRVASLKAAQSKIEPGTPIHRGVQLITAETLARSGKVKEARAIMDSFESTPASKKWEGNIRKLLK
ncbi:MAG: hypothetical protein AAF226_08780 [Verrucomicrobiota bacterium]